MVVFHALQKGLFGGKPIYMLIFRGVDPEHTSFSENFKRISRGVKDGPPHTGAMDNATV